MIGFYTNFRHLNDDYYLQVFLWVIWMEENEIRFEIFVFRILACHSLKIINDCFLLGEWCYELG